MQVIPAPRTRIVRREVVARVAEGAGPDFGGKVHRRIRVEDRAARLAGHRVVLHHLVGCGGDHKAPRLGRRQAVQARRTASLPGAAAVLAANLVALLPLLTPAIHNILNDLGMLIRMGLCRGCNAGAL